LYEEQCVLNEIEQHVYEQKSRCFDNEILHYLDAYQTSFDLVIERETAKSLVN